MKTYCRLFNRIAIVLLFVFASVTTHAQNDTTATSSSRQWEKRPEAGDSIAQCDSTQIIVFRVILKDGSEYLGAIESQDTVSITLHTLMGVTMQIPLSSVKKTDRIWGRMDGDEFYKPDPTQSRLFLAPTARGLAQGQGFYSVYEILFPHIAYGVTDYLTVAGGMSLMTLQTGAFYYISPQVNLPQLTKYIDVAVGVCYYNFGSSENKKPEAVAYGVGTIGSVDHALTVGLGWDLKKPSSSERPIIMLGYEVRTTSNTKLITENWLPINSKSFNYSVGFRFFGEHLSADFALIGSLDKTSKNSPVFPWFGFSYFFGTPNVKPMQLIEDKSAPSFLQELKISCSVGIPAYGLSRQYEESLAKQGYSNSTYADVSERGNVLTLQAKYFLNNRFALGGMVKTLGTGLGSEPEVKRAKYFSTKIDSAHSYSYYGYLKAKYSVVGYYLTGSYVLTPSGKRRLSSYFNMSGGIGMNVIKTNYSAAVNNRYYDDGAISRSYLGSSSASKQVIGFYIDTSLEHQLTPSMTVGLSVSYTYMPTVTIDRDIIPAGSVTTDEKTNATVPVELDILSHSIDFSHASFSVEVGWHF
jgi:hypothetical protein